MYYSETGLKWPLKKDQKLVFKTPYRLMQVKKIAECPKRAFCNISTFIKLPFVIKTFVLSIFAWLFYTGFTVVYFCMKMYSYKLCGFDVL